MRSRTTKAKRRTSAATLRRLKELRRKHGLGEFQGRKGSRRTKASRRGSKATVKLTMIDPFTLGVTKSFGFARSARMPGFTSTVSAPAGGGGSGSGSGSGG